MNVILYTTDCPKCKMLKKKLDEKNISYEENHDTEEMIALGFSTVPVLDVNGEVMDFHMAVEWINEKGGKT